ncbi:MAG: putative HTH-type transcriptional regulator [Candidatus Woesearchaeota archaeon]|nr:putative HTH-type transcriptional regulator [Candidatus Woesearchaeota archaeon]
MIAYLLISLGGSGEIEVLDRLTDLDEVVEAHILFGEWDLIAKVEIDSSEHMGRFVMEKIRSLPQIKITSTLIAAK